MNTLRRRLTFTHTIVALIAVVIVAALTVGLVLRLFDNYARLQAQAEAMVVSRRLALFYQQQKRWDGLVDFFDQRITQADLAAQRRRLQILDKNGNVIFDSAGPKQATAKAIGGVEVPITVNGQTVGTVDIGEQRGIFTLAERRFLVGVYFNVFIGSILAVLVALLVGLFISRKVTRPLRSLTQAARRLAAGERHQPLSAPSDVELAELANAFNTMAAELARQEDLRRQLVADIAHELRTPLSVLRLRVESLEDGVEQPTPAVLSELGQEVNLLGRLVDDLRLLSLADAGQLSLSIRDVDPHEAMERAAVAAAPRARQQGINLQVEQGDALPSVRADPQRLAQVLGNLIENALRYTPAGGYVTLRARYAEVHEQSAPAQPTSRMLQLIPQALRGAAASTLNLSVQSTSNSTLVNTRGSKVVIFEVVDTGSGIAPEDVPHIFDRFYRTDRARARETGGSGLGLAIVQRLVESQGGQVNVKSALGKGTVFRVQLPAA